MCRRRLTWSGSFHYNMSNCQAIWLLKEEQESDRVVKNSEFITTLRSIVAPLQAYLPTASTAYYAHFDAVHKVQDRLDNVLDQSLELAFCIALLSVKLITVIFGIRFLKYFIEK